MPMKKHSRNSQPHASSPPSDVRKHVESKPGEAGVTLWAVMKAQSWDSLSVWNGLPLRAPKEGPHKFIPVFNTREQAVAFDESEEHVVMLTLAKKEAAKEVL